ncbi:MAG: 50S ribosomal protein L2 [Candidatus Kerfeldbacteria bacterium]|nr:50S ribosomal protein L2 [Candidatus Kerfeldbacteria bacterium]
MPVKKYQPTTPGRRHASVLVWNDLTKKRPKKSLVERKWERAGRNSQGKITVRHRGSGVRRLYRVIDFAQQKLDVPARVEQLEYDPNRTARIALVLFRDGERRYILAPEGLKGGETIVASAAAVEVRTGNRTALEHIPTGIPISNIELVPGQGGKIVRSAGSAATVMSLEGKFAQVKLPSGEVRLIPKEAMATIGQMSNTDWRNVRLGKAGRMRQYGVRPRVRGKVMNPVDHPHGGGEGKPPIGMKHPKTPWGKPALGVPTRKKTKASNRFIVRRRKRRL